MQTPLLRPLQTLGKELSCLLLFYYWLLLGLAAVIVSSSLLIVWICDMRGKHFEKAKAIDLGPLLLLLLLLLLRIVAHRLWLPR